MILLFSLTACGKKDSKEDTKTTTKEYAVTVKDSSGRTVGFDKDTDKNTVCTPYGVMTPFFVALQMEQRVLATTFKNKGFLRMTGSSIVDAGSIGLRGVDFEALATYNPDVLILKTGAQGVDKAEALGVKVIFINCESIEDIIYTTTLLGKAFGVEERADELVKYFNDKLKMVEGIVSQIPEEQKKTAIVFGSEIGRVASGDMLQSQMLELAGAKCVVADIKNNLEWADIGTEKIFNLNPDYIFLTSSSVLDYDIEDITQSTIWAEMSAVKNGRVIKVPARMDSWDLPSPASLLGVMWMLNQMYPSYFSDEQMQSEIDQYYTIIYGKTFDSKTIGY